MGGRWSSSYITCEKFRMVLISDQKSVPKLNRPKCLSVRNFKRPKILRYSKTTLASRNKPDLTRKDLEMTGIVKAVTKKLEPEDPFKILVVDYLNHFELQSSYIEQTLGETLLEIRTCILLTEFVFNLFSYRYFC